MNFVFDYSKSIFLYFAIINSANQPPDAPRRPPPPGGSVSLEGFHGSVALPPPAARPWRQYLAFAGPALLVSVGYMDPGNWATDLQAGAQFKYTLLWVVGLSSLMAIFLQIISARLGIATGKDLAQCCRDFLPGLDPLAQLPELRGGHRRLRPGRGPGQRRRAPPALSRASPCWPRSSSPRSTCCSCFRSSGSACG
jgi:hypothetical protein